MGPFPRFSWSTSWSCSNYHLFHAVRAELLRRLGRMPEAAAAYHAAIGRCGNAREQDFLRQQLRTVE